MSTDDLRDRIAATCRRTMDNDWTDEKDYENLQDYLADSLMPIVAAHVEAERAAAAQTALLAAADDCSDESAWMTLELGYNDGDWCTAMDRAVQLITARADAYPHKVSP